MKCLTTNLEVNYPCSSVCPLFGDCAAAFQSEKKQMVRTRADRIRAMSDEELAEFINQCKSDNGPNFCKNLPICDADLETDTLIPLDRCYICLLDWLRQPAEEGADA